MNQTAVSSVFRLWVVSRGHLHLPATGTQQGAPSVSACVESCREPPSGRGAVARSRWRRWSPSAAARPGRWVRA
ncbi:hypothetical protein ACFPRL_19255 [Pseudoclavibacter helvolus]